MLSTAELDHIRQFAREVAEREGCQLYDLEFHDGPGRSLRVFIDKAGGVGVDDCANVSRALNLRLDVEDIIQSGYDLEVSSPGLDRKLTAKWHFEAAVDQVIKIKYSAGGRNQTIEARVNGVQGEVLRLNSARGELQVSLKDILSARVVPQNLFHKKMDSKKKNKKR